MNKRIPLKNFFRNPEQTQFRLSPNGHFLAWLAPYKNRLNVHVKKIDAQNETRITAAEDRDISSFYWANDNRILYARDFGGDENFHILGVNYDGTNNVDLTPYENVKAQMIDQLEGDDEHVLVGLNKRKQEVFDPYRLNIHTGGLEILAENPGNITSWIADHAGKIRLALMTDGVNNTLLYRKTEQDEFKAVLTTNFRDEVIPCLFTFDNQHLYALSNLNRDKLSLVKFDLEEGEEIEVIFEHPDVDLAGLSFSQKRKVLTHISYTTWKGQRHFLDERTANIHAFLEEKLPEQEVFIASSSKAEDQFLVRTYSDRSLGTYYFYDHNDKSLTKIKEVSPWLKKDELARMQPVSYKSRDGLTIHGYLTLPANGKAKNLPVVVNPHGGPWARDSWTFNPEVQFLANRGYGVLQMNFRGSKGFGRKFWEASFKEWGLKMQDDISDGVEWLIKEGIADADRIAIYGGSYGGYATLAGITFTPKYYACAVDYVGVSNIFTFLETIPPYWEPYLKIMKEMVGDPEIDKERLIATSPVFHADKIKAPLLIVQGAKDPRVKQSESDQMVEALRSRGVEVEYLLKENEGHGFRNVENRMEFYELMESFLGKHL